MYSKVKDAYKDVARPHIGQSDHISVFLYPAYKLLKRAPPVSKTVVWNEESDLLLQDCFESTNWDVFKIAALRGDSTLNLEEYAAAVTGSSFPQNSARSSPMINLASTVRCGPCYA